MRTRNLASVFTVTLGLCALGPALPARANGWNNFNAGLNGVLTAPADPIVRAVAPPTELRELPFSVVSSRIAGLLTGTFLAAFKVAAGALDIALAPTWVAPTLSPRPAFEVIPWHEVEYRY
jgi:ABC-type uncharacterized transport system permease subunit